VELRRRGVLVGSLRTGSGRSWKVQSMEVVWEMSFRGSFSAGREEKEGETLGSGVLPVYIRGISSVYRRYTLSAFLGW